MKTNQIVNSLKENNQDFEWYPTTREMIEVIYHDLHDNPKMAYSHYFSILDIGAGNGNSFKLLEDINAELKDTEREIESNITIKRRELTFGKFAIEKSTILINQFKNDIFLLGTDFHKQTLIDKKMDVIFSNPPYSEYVDWVEKIILESNCKTLYLVIPVRWKENKRIQKALQQRLGTKETHNKYQELRSKERYTILGTFSFYDSEYRTSRSNVDIVKISYEYEINDPFKVWFNTHFKINANTRNYSEYETSSNKKEDLKSKLVKGQNLIERLEELYNKDFENLFNIYKKIEELDYDILKELNVDITSISKGLFNKIKGLKDLYWKELLNNLTPVTNRLTSKSRKKLLETLGENTNIDFTLDNAYAVVLWTIKNSNVYFNEQLVDLYLTLSDSENVRNYKSNKRIIEGDWRWVRREYTHYTLDYRLIHQHHNCFNDSLYYDKINGLNDSAHNLLNDISTIGYNLGFDHIDTSHSFEWSPGKPNVFYYNNLSDDKEVFMEVRAYKKGTLHIKLNQKFMEKFNMEAGRLLGWIKSPKEASEEMDISIDTALELFGSNLCLEVSNVKLIGNNI